MTKKNKINKWCQIAASRASVQDLEGAKKAIKKASKLIKKDKP